MPVLAPAQAYAAFTKSGQPWHFPRKTTLRGRVKPDASPLTALLSEFGEPHQAIDVAGAARITEKIDQSGWSDDKSLVAKRLTWEERQAVIEADAIVRLVKGFADETPARAQREAHTFSKPVVVVDARCLQEPVYSTRGVGLHGRRVLEAIRTVTSGYSMVLLTSADGPTLLQDVADLADYDAVRQTPSATPTSHYSSSFHP